MKKILAISIIAMTAVTAANAEIASKLYVDGKASTAESNANTYTDSRLGAIPSNSDVATEIASAITTAGSNQVQANWIETTTTSKAYIQNKPTLGALSSKDEVGASDLDSSLSSTIAGKANTADLGDLAVKDEVSETDLDTALATKVNAGASALQPASITAASGNNLVSYGANGLVTGGVAAGALATKSTVEETDLDSSLAAKVNAGNTALQPTAASGTTGTKLVEYNATTGLVTGGQTAGALATKNTIATADIDAKAVTGAKMADHTITATQLPEMPSVCANADCILEAHNGVMAWELVERATGETLTPSTASSAVGN